MPFTISKEFAFSAAHSLAGVPVGHPCARLHGHNYVVRVELSTPFVDRVGFVRDYRELAPVKAYIDDQLDHRNLNDALDGLNPTAENLARHLFDLFKPAIPELSAVAVSETPKTWAVYRP